MIEAAADPQRTQTVKASETLNFHVSQEGQSPGRSTVASSQFQVDATLALISVTNVT